MSILFAYITSNQTNRIRLDEQLHFVPIGESSWLYRAHTNDGNQVAVKIQPEDNSAVDEALRVKTVGSK